MIKIILGKCNTQQATIRKTIKSHLELIFLNMGQPRPLFGFELFTTLITTSLQQMVDKHWAFQHHVDLTCLCFPD